MSTLIYGLNPQTLLLATSNAIAKVTGSPVKDAKVRTFLTEQFGLRNEHCIPALFAPRLGDAKEIPADEICERIKHAQKTILASEQYQKGPNDYFDKFLHGSEDIGKLLNGNLSKLIAKEVKSENTNLLALAGGIDACISQFKSGDANAVHFYINSGQKTDAEDRNIHEVVLRLDYENFSFMASLEMIEFSELDGISFEPAENFHLNYRPYFRVSVRGESTWGIEEALTSNESEEFKRFWDLCTDAMISFGRDCMNGIRPEIDVPSKSSPELAKAILLSKCVQDIYR